MDKKSIKTDLGQNNIRQYTRGASVTKVIKASETLELGKYKNLGVLNGPRSFEHQLRDIIITFMRILKVNGYPYRPSYRIASNDRTGIKSLLSRLKEEFGLKPLDTYYILGDFIQQYHIMKLRQDKGATSGELIELAFKLGNTHQKVIIFLKESSAKSKAAKHSRTNPDVAESIARLAKTEMTAHEAFSQFVNYVEGEEYVVDEKLHVKYLNEKGIEEKLTFKTFQNRLSKERNRNHSTSR